MAANRAWHMIVMLLAGYCLPVQGADLLEVYYLAKANDPTYDAAKYAFLAAREKIPQALAGLLPVVNLSGSDNSTRGQSKFTGYPEVNRDVRAWTWNLQLTQPLIRVQNIYAYRASDALVIESHAKYALAEQDLILRVARAYLDVLTAQKNIEVIDAQLRATGEQLALVKRGFETGANAITDTDEAKSRADLARALRIAALNELEARRAELEKVTGQASKTIADLQPAAAVPGLQPEDARAWIDLARENNPAVLAPRAALQVAEFEISRNRAAYLPTLDMVASIGQNYSSGSLSMPGDFATRARSGVAGVQLTVPLFAGGMSNSRVAEARANRNKAAAELEAARRQAATDARQAYSAITSGLAQIEALESAVESSQNAVKGNRVGYRLGIRMNIDVLNAEQQLFTAQRDLVKARYDTLLQGFKLKAAAGALTEADVLAANGLFGAN